MLFLDEYTHYCITYLLSHKRWFLGFLIFKNFTDKTEADVHSKIVDLALVVLGEYIISLINNCGSDRGISYHSIVPVNEWMVFQTVWLEKNKYLISNSYHISGMIWIKSCGELLNLKLFIEFGTIKGPE